MAFSISIETRQLDHPILQLLTSTGVATAVHTPGEKWVSDDGREFQYVINDSGSGGVAAVAGAPAVWQGTTTRYCVTPDVSDAAGTGSGVAGAYLSVLGDTYYGFIQTAGFLKDAPVSDGSGAAGITADEPLGVSDDGYWTKITVGGTVDCVGGALEDDTSGYADIQIYPK